MTQKEKQLIETVEMLRHLADELEAGVSLHAFSLTAVTEYSTDAQGIVRDVFVSTGDSGVSSLGKAQLILHALENHRTHCETVADILAGAETETDIFGDDYPPQIRVAKTAAIARKPEGKCREKPSRKIAKPAIPKLTVQLGRNRPTPENP